MPRKIPELSKLQIGRIRANLSSQASNIGVRLRKHALGTLVDKDKNPIEMTSTQIKAAELILKHVLPGQQSTEFNDVTEPEKSMDQIEAEYQQALENLPVQDLTEVLRNMDQDTRQALIDSMGETTQ